MDIHPIILLPLIQITLRTIGLSLIGLIPVLAIARLLRQLKNR